MIWYKLSIQDLPAYARLPGQVPAWFDLLYALCRCPSAVTLYSSVNETGPTTCWWLSPAGAPLLNKLAALGCSVSPVAAPDKRALRYVAGDCAREACVADVSDIRRSKFRMPLLVSSMLKLLRATGPVGKPVALAWLQLKLDRPAINQSLERIRWGAKGQHCPHCGGQHVAKSAHTNKYQRVVYQCGDCDRRFDVLSATVLGVSEIAARTWVLIWHLHGAGWRAPDIAGYLRISESEVARMLGVMLRGALERHPLDAGMQVRHSKKLAKNTGHWGQSPAAI